MLRETGGVIVFFCFFLKGDVGAESIPSRPLSLSLSLSFSSFKSIQRDNSRRAYLFFLFCLFRSAADDTTAADGDCFIFSLFLFSTNTAERLDKVCYRDRQ